MKTSACVVYETWSYIRVACLEVASNENGGGGMGWDYWPKWKECATLISAALRPFMVMPPGEQVLFNLHSPVVEVRKLTLPLLKAY